MVTLDGGDSTAARLLALLGLNVLDPAAEPAFDNFVHLAAHVCDAPAALIGLLDQSGHSAETLVVADLATDARFICGGFLPFRFYAGVPLLTRDGIAIGALCVVDHAPRPDGLTPRQLRSLHMLAAQVTAQLDLHQGDHEDRSRLALLVNQAVVGIAQTDLDGRFTLVNDRFCTLLGCGRAEALTRRSLDTIHPDDQLNHSAMHARMLATGENITMESRIVRPDDTIVWVKTHCSMLRAPSGEPSHIIAIVQDVTAERAARSALWEMAESLEQRVTDEVSQRVTVEHALHQAQKMEAISCLSGGLAHDFNNMLASMIANLELLEGRLGERDLDARRYLSGAMDSADRAAGVAKRLLAFSRKQELAPRATEVSALVASMLLLVRHTVGARIAVEAALAEDLASTLCDPNQLESALLNLVINARDSIAEVGRITIATAGLLLRPQDSADWGDLAPGRYVTLSVTDTGAGMVTDVVARAFEPFFTTKPAHQGTGMGLYMLHSFARQARGHVRVRSQPGRGTTVELCLPCLTPDALATPAFLPWQMAASA